MEGEKPPSFGRSRGRANRKAPSTADITQLEDAAEECVPLMRSRGRAKHSTRLPLARRPGGQALGVPSSRSAGVSHGAADIQIASDLEIEEGLSALNINPIKGSSSGGSASEQGHQAPSKLSVLCTKPKDMLSKKGTTGHTVQLQTNYFRLPTVTNWQLYQYRVDFSPEEDSNAEKKRMVREFKEMLGGYLFDGTMLYTPHKYQQDPMIFHSTRPSDNIKVCIMVRLMGLLAFGDYHYVQFFNILMQQCLDNLKLQLVGRYYYDPSARIILDKHQLEIWPGYVTSIRQHENELLLCAEVTHKVMRHDTAYSLLERCCKSDSGEFQRLFEREILGSIVLTIYNNKTYLMGDVDFSVTPATMFNWNGIRTSYADYFSQETSTAPKYKKRSGTVGMHGHLYEVRAATFLFARGLNKTKEFRLASNVDGAGAFDDLVFRYSLKEQDFWKTCFIQLKHKNKEYKVQRNSLKQLSGNFSLFRYFESYCQIKRSASTDRNLKICGPFVDFEFVIYTNAKVGSKSAVTLDETNPLSILSSEPNSGEYTTFDETGDKDIFDFFQELSQYYSLISELDNLMKVGTCMDKDMENTIDISEVSHQPRDISETEYFETCAYKVCRREVVEGTREM